MKEEKIREAFAKAKQDIFNLQSHIDTLNRQIQELKRTIEQNILDKTDRQTNRQTIRQINQAENIITSAELASTTHSSTHNYHVEALEDSKSNISTGNEGVSTDRQTDQQTDNSTGNQRVKVRFNTENQTKVNKIDHLEKVAQVINSLDSIKKDLRNKIKRLTNQEIKVYSSVYQLEEKGFIVDYSLLAQHLAITESSIRDYIQRILKKGLPLEKMKENNKKITLKIPEDFKKIAPLSTILQLREL